ERDAKIKRIESSTKEVSYSNGFSTTHDASVLPHSNLTALTQKENFSYSDSPLSFTLNHHFPHSRPLSSPSSPSSVTPCYSLSGIPGSSVKRRSIVGIVGLP